MKELEVGLCVTGEGAETGEELGLRYGVADCDGVAELLGTEGEKTTSTGDGLGGTLACGAEVETH
jgi:hypothetical protein